MKFLTAVNRCVVNRNVSPDRLLMVVLFCLLSPYSATAKPLDKPVADYQLQCDETFSCPVSLKPRVSFWVEVFSRWDTQTAIFHDKDNPHRVYSTVARERGCRGSRRGDAADRERKRLTADLKSTARKVANGQPLNAAEQQLKGLFPGASSSEIKAAAGRIRCQSGNKDRMLEALKQFRLYQPTILDALESQNLTKELQYLPFVESAFNPKALSHVGAAGLWQIMPATGRSLGLMVTSTVDERYDPARATYAAAKYFRDSVDQLTEVAFENGHTVTPKDLNPFVITSYNYGVRGMQRAVKQVGLDYERLLVEYKSPNFQTAVKNFYASFLAARHVAKNAEKFFGNISVNRSERAHANNAVNLARPTSVQRLQSELNLDADVFKRLNPALKKVVWNNKALIPIGYELRLPYQDNGWDSQLRQLASLPAEYVEPGYTWHRVRRGQTACGIAKKYGASCRALFRLNSLDRRGTIITGRRIKVPTRNGGISVAASSGGGTSSSTSSAVYTVRSGDTACKIARRHQMNCDTFLARNGLHRRSVIKVGQRLKVSAEQAPGVRTTTASSTTYRVKSGDTACVIAERHSMKCTEFLAVNGLNRKSILRVGQKVVVSAENTWHTVSRGQTACGIAERYKVSCRGLLSANRLNTKSTIRIGQRLRIPVK